MKNEEMFYLTTHSTHFITVILVLDIQKKGRNVLFNDTLNTFYYGYIFVRHIEEGRNALFNDAVNSFYYGYICFGCNKYCTAPHRQ